MTLRNAIPAAQRTRRRSLCAAGLLIGLAMGGFFDGILLHQILQWHHLLSLVRAPVLQDLRMQILADGLFHALMYLVAAAGLGLLWRARNDLSGRNAGRWLGAMVLFGFGVWNIADAVLFHWVLRIHRIRIDAVDPLFWDLLWFAVFGIGALIGGGIVLIKAGPGGPPQPGHGTSIASLISATVIASGAVAMQPPVNPAATLVMFRQGVTPAAAFQAFDAVDGRVLWADRSGSVWAIKVSKDADTMRLYRHGALLVSSSMLGLGCFSWLQAG